MSIFIDFADLLTNKGDAKIKLDDFLAPNAGDEVQFLLSGEDVGEVHKITLEDFDKAGDNVEVVIDLSTFTSDFELKFKDERPDDTITLQGAGEITVNNNGSREVTFIDANGEERTLKIAANDAAIEIERSGGLEIGPGVGRDDLEGEEGDDTIDGGAGNDTINGGSGDDSISAGVDQSSLGGSGLRAKDFPLIKLTNHEDIDVDESNGVSENASDLLGTYGDTDAPLNSEIVFAYSNDLNDDDRLDDNDGGKTAETFIIQGEELELDSVQTYFATVTFTDGSSGDFTAVVIQLENGDVFLAPEPFENEDSALLESGEIQSISLNQVQTSDTNLYGLRLDSAYQIGDADFVDAGDGNDTVDGGIGDDEIKGGTGGDLILGGAGADQLFGGSGDDVLEGGSGDDYLKVGSGQDVAYGGDGDDTLQNASGDDLLFGGFGDDSISANVGADTLFGGSGRDTLVGGSGDDSLVGDSGDDQLFSGSGDDQLFGGDGFDQLYGGTGADALFGGDSFDDLYGGSGDDTLVSGTIGDSYLFGGAGADSLILSDFSDSAEGGSGADTIVGGDAGDTIFGGSGADSLIGGGGDDTLTAGSGDDTVDLGDIQAGDDVSIFGGDGYDVLDLSNAGDATFNLDFTGIEEIRGSDFGDNYNWNAQAITFVGGASGDVIDAGELDDTLFGGGGADSLAGNAGNDSIDGGDGADTVLGGAGDDSLSGGAAADSIVGGVGNDEIEGGSGNDVLLGDGDLSTPGATVNVNGSNFSDTSSGFTVTARNVVPDGGGGFTLSSSSVSNVSTFSGGIGASGNISDSDSAVQEQVGFDKASGLSEELSIAFDQDLDELSFQFEVLFTSSFGETGNYALYNDGVLVHQADFTEQSAGSGSGQVNVAGHGLFDEIVFTGKLQTDGTDGSDFIISDVEFTTAGGAAAGGNDTIDGGIGADSIEGEGGDDSLLGGANDDFVYGGSGDDTLSGGSGDDQLFGGDGVDQLFGGSGGDSITTGSGNDSVVAGSGDDVVFGGANVDTIFGGEGNDTLDGGENTDFVYGGGGADSIDDTGGSSSDDTLFGGAGNDTISGGAREDLISGDSGDDSLSGGAGADTIFGGEGDDSLTTGSGNDQLFGGAGADTLRNSSGDDSLVGGSGDDLIVASVGNDTLEGGEGQDTLIGGSGDDSLVGGAGNDQIFGGSGDDQAFGGSGEDTFLFADNFGSDTIVGGEGGTDFDTLDFTGLMSPVTINFTSAEAGTATSGGDTIIFSEIEHFLLTDGNDLVFGSNIAGSHFIDAGAGDDQIESTDGADTVEAGSGDDSIDGNQGADLIYGGAGADTLDGDEEADTLHGGSGDDLFLSGSGNDVAFGGDGKDTLGGSSGDDSLTGGEGFDTFVIGSGNDTISDFGTATGAILNDGDQTNNDFVDLDAYYDNISEVRGDFLDDGVLNQSNATDDKGRSVDYSDNTAMSGGTRFEGASSSDFTQDSTNVVCFAAGASIDTPRGTILVEDLSVGDLVETRDRGAQPIVWIGRQVLGAAQATPNSHTRPVRICANALGSGIPFRDLVVSAQHRMLASGPIVERMFEFAEVLAPAKALIGYPGIEYEPLSEDIVLIHFLLSSHSIVSANGAPSETFYPGEIALSTLSNLGQAAIRLCLPDLEGDLAVKYPPARPFITGRQGRSLVKRLKKNGKPLMGKDHVLPAGAKQFGA